jgi:exonuclease SbcC
MRILAIRGKNLASLEGEFEVDFTAEPLKSAGIFAITGSTGSGKSTLLDAICLALFNETPRISRAEDANIADVKERTIKQRDPRNILRRGTADGYAEVDFVSLAGDKYRARWSVRRARDKVDGSLQDWNYRVSSITSGHEIQGGKMELLAQVRNLIGLTFDQFTRAVLLAQGDFATFLKANKNDKAELLEKLTGTDIYSRISVRIYENTQQAKNELALIEDRIKGVELLPEEQIIALTAEKEDAEKEAGAIDADIKILSEKRQWLQANEQLVKSVEQAKQELVQSKSVIENAKPRLEYLMRVEGVQEIRDSFRQLDSDRKQLITDETSLKEQQAQSTANNERLTQAKVDLETCRVAKNLLATEWQKIEPQINEARKLDIQIEGVTKNLSDIEKDVSQVAEQKAKCEKSIESCGKKIEAINKSQGEIAKWFAENKHYAEIIPRVELIISFINDSLSAGKQASRNDKLLKDISELLKREDEQLALQQVEAKRLNDILPAEIAVLRAKLADNEPCPVCGSIHHPIRGLSVESLKEDELNKAKNSVAREIERLTEIINNRKDEMIRLRSLIDGYNEQHKAAWGKLTETIKAFPDWETKYKTGTLINDLTIIAKDWQSNDAQRTALTEQLAAQNQEQTASRQRLVELTDNHNEKKARRTAVFSELEELKAKRKEILEGAKADEVEKSYREKLDAANKQVDNAVESQNNLTATGEKIAGIISQLIDNTSRLKRNVEELDKNISEWLSNRTDGLTWDVLAELLAKDNDWLVTERGALNGIKNAELTAQTKLTERQNQASEHQMKQIKPTDEETGDFLKTVIEDKTQCLNQKQERITEIGVLFTNHAKGQERIKQFEKALTEKRLSAENWQKLNELFGSASGDKFKVLAQGYTLDVLLGYTNTHLKDISQRYLLQRVSPDSLSLQVVDLDMLSEVRSVHSLSGGESFLISLSLALGLSSLSSNRMRVESLFIDEGFGSLDADTLRVAMDSLERLQTQGRKIGVISHVAEMTERIPTQIQVIKTVNGRSKIEIKG